MAKKSWKASAEEDQLKEGFYKEARCK